jgi:hypothetical protein
MKNTNTTTMHGKMSLLKLLFIACFLISWHFSYAIDSKINSNDSKSAKFIQQEKVLKGTVLDENQQPLPGATVQVKGSSRGVITDIDGTFSLNVTSDDVLIVSFIGYTNTEVKVGNNTSLSIS